LRLVVAALMLRGDEVFICQRRPDQPMALQWEFPGGKIEPGEGPEAALARELNEELGIDATIGPRVTHIRHNYRHGGAVDLQFLRFTSFAESWRIAFSRTCAGFGWKICRCTIFSLPTAV
jgi:8-oxo-dGTP diphosphatase